VVTDIFIGDVADDEDAHAGDVLGFDVGRNLAEVRTSDPPRFVQLVDQDGNNLPERPLCRVSVSLPGYLATDQKIAGGRLWVYARGNGLAVLTVHFDDPVAGHLEKTLEFLVYGSTLPEVSYGGLQYGGFRMTYGDYIMGYE
jgi:hypothetical protein